MFSDLSSNSADVVKRSLILGGGGMRVGYQAGVLRALEEEGIVFNHIDGASGGTINLAMLLSGLSPTEMCRRWNELRVSDFVSFLPIADYLRSPKLKSMGDARGLRDKVFPALGIEMEKLRSCNTVQATFNVCNFTKKTNLSIPHQEMDMDYLIAAVSLPIFMPPVEKNGELFLDSVWIKDGNVTEAVKRGAEEVWVVWMIGNSPKYRPGVFNQYVHMIELSANGALFEEFSWVRDLNDRIIRGDSPYGQKVPIRLHLIHPRTPLPLDPDYFVNSINAATLINQGYADTKRYLGERLQQGQPWQPEVTYMIDQASGITFRETMSGGFALGETDPKQGLEKARGTTLALHATITIDDMDAFVRDAQHAGNLVGHIDFAPLGMGLSSSSGVFNIFSRSEDPKTKFMVYEMGFVQNGKDYYFAGKKEVRDDPGFDLWKDTTSLYSTLHEGKDAKGKIIGAGVLTLSVPELLKLVSTVRPVGAESAIEGAGAIAKFGTFFLGQLWERYGAAKFS